jgi:hypothetical protein
MGLAAEIAGATELRQFRIRGNHNQNGETRAVSIQSTVKLFSMAAMGGSTTLEIKYKEIYMRKNLPRQQLEYCTRQRGGRS